MTRVLKKADFSKADMLACIFRSSGVSLLEMGVLNVHDFLSNFSYAKVGEHYELRYHGINPDIASVANGKWFDESGQETKDKVPFSILGEEKIYLKGSCKIDEEEKYDLEQKIRDIQAENGKKFKSGLLLGKDLILYSDMACDPENRVVYSLDENGGFMQASEDHRRLVDDIEESKTNRKKFDRINRSFIGVKLDKFLDMIETGILNQSIDLTDTLILLNRFKGTKLSEDILKQIQQYYIDDTDFSKRDMIIEMARQVDYKMLANIEGFYYQEVENAYRLTYTQKISSDIAGFDEFEPDCVIGYFSRDGKKLQPPIENMETGKINQTIGQVITSKVPRRLIDDMSMVDLILMHETAEAGVTVQDMIAVSKQIDGEPTKKIEKSDVDIL